MSRPYDAQRTVFHFVNPFKGIFSKGSHLSPKLLSLLNSFEQQLAKNYEKLKPKHLAGVSSLYWMRTVMLVLVECHKSIKALIDELQFPVSDWDEKWIDMYFDSSVEILDICIALCSEVSKLDQGQLLIRYVRHVLDTSNNCPSSKQLKKARVALREWKIKIDSKNPKLESCISIFQSLQGTLYFPRVRNSAEGKVLMRALYGVKVMTVYFFSVLVAALSGCSQSVMDLHVSGKFLWVGAFNELKSAVDEEVRNQKSRGKVPRLKELEAVETCVAKFHALSDIVDCKEEPIPQSNGIEQEEDASSHEKSTDSEENQNLIDCINTLADEGERLGHELDVLSKQVNEFFRVVMSGRDALMCNLRAFYVPQGSDVGEKTSFSSCGV